jgi:hypothetical protein
MSPSRKQTIAVAALFVALTIAMTWPQVLVLGSQAREHQDVYFNMWRIGWIAHALATAPTRLFDGNIFYPEPRTLTYSDAMVVEGLFGAPLLWVGVPRVLVHNVLLLSPIVASAVGVFVLTRHLTGSGAPGVLAGIIFAFAPYRFEHYMHMELQWTVWMPWAFWALHRTLESGSWRFGVGTGAFVALQMLSSIYYGVFLATLLPIVAILLMIAQGRSRLWRSVRALAPGALLAGVLCIVYAQPYLATKQETGGRSEQELVTFAARPSSYLVATPDNVLWGRAFAGRGRLERRLFPGLTAIMLALVGLLLRPPPAAALAYFVALTVGFDMSLGLSGQTYGFLYDYVPIYHGLRALARLGIFVVFFLAILAAYGTSAAVANVPSRWRRVLPVLLCVMLLLEYRVKPLPFVPYPNAPPPLSSWLAEQPRGVVAELPLRGEPLPGADPEYAYLSTFHWQPMVNGYSGFYPQSYLDRRHALSSFPDDVALMRLRQDNVRYAVVHLREFTTEEGLEVLETLRERYGLPELGRLFDGRGEAAVFRLR